MACRGLCRATDVDGETLTYGIVGGTPSGVNEVSLTGTYGTLTVNTVSGAYTFTKDAAAIEALDATETDSDVLHDDGQDGDGRWSRRPTRSTFPARTMRPPPPMTPYLQMKVSP